MHSPCQRLAALLVTVLLAACSGADPDAPEVAAPGDPLGAPTPVEIPSTEASGSAVAPSPSAPATVRTPQGTEEPTATPTPTAPATATATPAPAASSPTSTPTTAPAPAAPPPPAAPDVPAPPPPPAGPNVRDVGQVADRSGDAGLEAPARADIVAVFLQDTGGNAIITVEVAGPMPATPAAGEVFGVGVDLTADGSAAGYQVFASGTDDGWEGYFTSPAGVFDLPGDLRIGARTVTFEVPWIHFDSATRGTFSAFVDWSEDRPAVNRIAEDHAPDGGTAPFQR